MNPEQLHQSFAEAFNARRAVRGAAAIREAYQRFLAGKPAMELRTLGAFQAGDLALLFGKWILRETAPDGRVVQREGFNTGTVRRRMEGHWLFVIDQPYTPR